MPQARDRKRDHFPVVESDMAFQVMNIDPRDIPCLGTRHSRSLIGREQGIEEHTQRVAAWVPVEATEDGYLLKMRDFYPGLGRKCPARSVLKRGVHLRFQQGAW